MTITSSRRTGRARPGRWFNTLGYYTKHQHLWGRGWAGESIQGGAGLRPRGMRGGLECWVNHGVGSRFEPYKQSERPRAAKKLKCSGVREGEGMKGWAATPTGDWWLEAVV